ncbi:MAG TPA: fimbria/pilus outer membrane usher protein [Usitatibacter sp.]|nr:fimbria/pilus outer membrane usher protein [Usitatibacter sp.]
MVRARLGRAEWVAALLWALHPQPLPAQSAAASAAPPAASADRILPLEVTINGAKGGTWVFIERAGILYAPRDAFTEWRVEPSPEAAAVDFRGERYWPLSSVPGFKARVDFATQSVQLLFSPEAFTALRLSRGLAARPALSPVLPSAFVNYDVNYAASTTRGGTSTHDVGVLTEVGLSNKWGVLTSSHVARHVSSAQSDGSPRFLRLETTFTRDYPDTNRTLRVGDTSTRPGLWGRNVYFGGVQMGTNFGLTPGFVSQPLPVLRGLSAAPSTVELYVNDVLRQVSNVPTGPFAIDNFPLMTGSGEARLVVRDLLGRETVIVQSFFANNQLLARGLDDWSAEAGAVRQGLGTVADKYGDGFASGTWRRGVSERLTVEGRGEATRRLRTLGLGATTALPGRVLATVAAVLSDHRSAGRGSSWLLGLERDSARQGFSLQAQGASRDFRLLGQEEEFLPNRLQVAGNWTYFTPDQGSLGLGFASISRYGEERVTTLSANYSRVLWQRSSVNIAASRAIGGAAGSSVGFTFVVPLDDRRTASASATRRSGTTDFYAAANETPTRDSALGWRALAGRQQEQSRVEGGLYYLGERGTLSGEASASPDRRALRVGGSGGTVLADGRFFATRRVDQAYALAEVPGYPDVGIGIGSNVLTRTNQDGVALIPNLWPYQSNSVRIDPKDLPVSAELDAIEINIVPSWRSAVKVDFPVRSGRGALIRVVLDDGEAAPAGATVEVEGDKAQFYVARRGEAFVTGLQPRNRVALNWKGNRCAFDVTLPPPNRDEVPRLGPFACKGLAR